MNEKSFCFNGSSSKGTEVTECLRWLNWSQLSTSFFWTMWYKSVKIMIQAKRDTWWSIRSNKGNPLNRGQTLSTRLDYEVFVSACKTRKPIENLQIREQKLTFNSQVKNCNNGENRAIQNNQEDIFYPDHWMYDKSFLNVSPSIIKIKIKNKIFWQYYLQEQE